MYFNGINPTKMIKKDLKMFYRFYITGLIRTGYAKITKRKLRSPIYVGHFVKKQNIANEILKKMILQDKPFMFGRYGSNELLIAGYAIMYQKGIIDEIPLKKIELACAQCGFFPVTQEAILDFAEILIEASKECTMYGTFRMIWEDYFIEKYMPRDVILTHLNMLDFWKYDEPFICKLKGKKVLVIHPLAKQICKQYKNRKKIFNSKEWLPDFELKTIEAIQTIAGNRDDRFSSWKEALEYMQSEVDKITFDIAILGCGAYGMPLAAYIKKSGKQVIYMGGVLQMMFGIRGNRWDKDPKASALYNEYWVSPSKESVPKNSDIVEQGCYW